MLRRGALTDLMRHCKYQKLGLSEIGLYIIFLRKDRVNVSDESKGQMNLKFDKFCDQVVINKLYNDYQHIITIAK